jgi:hypothetical protein
MKHQFSGEGMHKIILASILLAGCSSTRDEALDVPDYFTVKAQDIYLEPLVQRDRLALDMEISDLDSTHGRWIRLHIHVHTDTLIVRELFVVLEREYWGLQNWIGSIPIFGASYLPAVESYKLEDTVITVNVERYPDLWIHSRVNSCSLEAVGRCFRVTNWYSFPPQYEFVGAIKSNRVPMPTLK